MHGEASTLADAFEKVQRAGEGTSEEFGGDSALTSSKRVWIGQSKFAAFATTETKRFPAALRFGRIPDLSTPASKTRG